MDFARWEEQLCRGDVPKGYIGHDIQIQRYRQKQGAYKGSKQFMIVRIWGQAEGRGEKNKEVCMQGLICYAKERCNQICVSARSVC